MLSWLFIACFIDMDVSPEDATISYFGAGIWLQDEFEPSLDFGLRPDDGMGRCPQLDMAGSSANGQDLSWTTPSHRGFGIGCINWLESGATLGDEPDLSLEFPTAPSWDIVYPGALVQFDAVRVSEEAGLLTLQFDAWPEGISEVTLSRSTENALTDLECPWPPDAQGRVEIPVNTAGPETTDLWVHGWGALECPMKAGSCDVWLEASDQVGL